MLKTKVIYIDTSNRVKPVNTGYSIENRETGLLDFHYRVLLQAEDPTIPKLAQLMFIAIYDGNMQEAFQVRLPRIMLRKIDHRSDDRYNSGHLPRELHKHVFSMIKTRTTKRQELYEKKLDEIKELGIDKVCWSKFDIETKQDIREQLQHHILPILQPQILSEKQKPELEPGELTLVARLKNGKVAYIPIPAKQRLITLSKNTGFDFIYLEEVLRNNLDLVLPGQKVKETTCFLKHTNSNYEIRKRDDPNPEYEIIEGINARSDNYVVLIEIEDNASEKMTKIINSVHNYYEEEIRYNTDLDLKKILFNLMFTALSNLKKPELGFRQYEPVKPEYDNIFDWITEKDHLLQLPYHSFEPTIELIEQAAVDPNVTKLYHTLYRTDEESRIMQALIKAAENGKEVFVIVEEKARFDEANNVHWRRKLENAGGNVINPFVRIKVHAKSTYVERIEGDKMVHYVHAGTGNYNAGTAKLYVDLGYFTKREDVAEAFQDLFESAASRAVPQSYPHVLLANLEMRERFYSMIDDEMSKGKDGYIFAKMNQLEDQRMIEKLYDASRAGVKIDLLVRGFCRLKPGVRGLSDNITVKSIVGRFLEHPRTYIFGKDNPKVFIGSADWMRRNLSKRIEHTVEILDKDVKKELQEICNIYWSNDTRSWLLMADGSYLRLSDTWSKEDVHETFISRYLKNGESLFPE